MHIGIDGLPLTAQRTGVGHYTLELAVALARLADSNDVELVYPSTYPVIVLATDNGSLPANLSLARVGVGPIRRHWWSTGLPLYLRKRKFDLFHGTNYDVPFWRRCATVLTIHDLSLLLFPETHRRRSVTRARRRLPLMARNADAIITPTESVRREVCEHLQVDRDCVFAVPEAPRTSFRPMSFSETEGARSRLGCGDEFILAVGTIEPRKNLAVLLAAFEKLIREPAQQNVRLVIAGGKGWLSTSFLEAIRNSAGHDRIIMTGYLHDEDLRALYSSCRAFVYPSLYEGFGLPPLEAMACGAPVIASRISSLQETGGDAAMYFESDNADDLTKVIRKLLGDETERTKLALSGQARAAEFSWEKAAEATLKVYSVAMERFAAKK